MNNEIAIQPNCYLKKEMKGKALFRWKGIYELDENYQNKRLSSIFHQDKKKTRKKN